MLGNGQSKGSASLSDTFQGLRNRHPSHRWLERRQDPTSSSLHSCSVFLLDQNELVAKVFDGGVVDDEVREYGGCPGVS